MTERLEKEQTKDAVSVIDIQNLIEQKGQDNESV